MHSFGVQGWGGWVSGLGLRVLLASSIKTDCGKLKRSEYSHGQSDRHINVKSSHSFIEDGLRHENDEYVFLRLVSVMLCLLLQL